MVTTYNETSSHLTKIIRRHLHIVRDFYKQILLFSKCTPFFVQESIQFKDRLVKTDTDPTSGKQRKGKLGCYACMSCDNCGQLIRGPVFTHPGTGETFKIRHCLTCRHDHVIYALQHPCHLLYIGETTTERRLRINNHKSAIRTGKVKLPVLRHFAEFGHTIADLKFSIIDQVPPLKQGGNREKILNRKEVVWNNRLGTIPRRGLNLDYPLHFFL